MQCPKCGEVAESQTKTPFRYQSFPVLGASTDVIARRRECNRCGSELYDEVLDSAALEAAYVLYRMRHDLPAGTPLHIQEVMPLVVLGS